MVDSTTRLAAIQTARQLHRTADVEVQHVMAVLRGLELSHRARDIQHVEVV